MSQSRVLVIEDERTVAALLRGRLEREGYEVQVVGDGLSACKAIGENPPDLILLDLMLPILDGWEVCSIVRTLPDPDVSRTPIIMLTSQASEEDRLRGLRSGANEYITKPFSMDEVLSRVQEQISRTSAADAAPRRNPKP
ncbi:MAG: response regulator [Proteobacteria bacterium]|nr:response regulator [Pseudomonadota bacterium]